MEYFRPSVDNLATFPINLNLDSFLEKSSFLVTVSQHFVSIYWRLDYLNSLLGFACIDVLLVEAFQISRDSQIQFSFRK